MKIRFSIKPKWEINYITDDLEIEGSFNDEDRHKKVMDAILRKYPGGLLCGYCEKCEEEVG